jgi:hypothetical protein
VGNRWWEDPRDRSERARWEEERARPERERRTGPFEAGRDMGESYTERYREERPREDERESWDIEREARFARGVGDTRWGTGGMRAAEERAPRRPPAAEPPAPTWARGPYAGRGPRGYRRSDERIREDVCDRFTEHGWLDASDIEVDVAHGEVTLTGLVASRAAKRLAEDVAESVSGVVEIHNQLRIRREQGDVERARAESPREPSYRREAPEQIDARELRRANDLPAKS